MSPSETTPLLDGPLPNGEHTTVGFTVRGIFKAEGEPSWAASFRFLFLQSWFNLFLVFIPLSVTSHFLNWDAGLRFLFSFLAIIPLAKLLGESTEQLSMKMGQTWGGLLNASFGNAVEIIVGVAALALGELRIVQTSMLGSILSNLLLVLGMSFFTAGIYYRESTFQQTAAQASSSLMTLACLTLVIPAAYHASRPAEHVPAPDTLNALGTLKSLLSETEPVPSGDSGLLWISRGSAILLLLVYFAYLYFQLNSHAYLFKSPDDDEEEEPSMSMIAAMTSLLVITLTTSFCADYLVASIEETAQKYHIPKPFIGVILLPLVSNAAEHVTSVWMAAKNKMELTIGIAVGSSIQIAVFVIPLLVLVGWIIGQPLTLYFENFETVCLFVTVLLVNLLVQDGRSNYMEGLMLCTLYIIIAISFWVSN